MPVTLNVKDHLLDMTRVAEDVFRTALGMEITVPERHGLPRNCITAAVQFAGVWQGAVLVQCTTADAIRVCSKMMPGVSPAQFDADVIDAMGELANMLGGNLKSVLPPGVALSTPIVTEGTDFGMHLCGGNDSRAIAFQGDLGNFELTLVYVPSKN